MPGVQLHLLDATYELFRSHFGRPPHAAADGTPVGATVGVIERTLSLVRDDGVTRRRTRTLMLVTGYVVAAANVVPVLAHLSKSGPFAPASFAVAFLPFLCAFVWLAVLYWLVLRDHVPLVARR